MSRANKILDELYAKENRKRYILICLPVIVIVMLIVVNIPLSVSRYEGEVSESPYLAPNSAIGMGIRLLRMVDGRGGASTNRTRYNCPVDLNTGESIIARCPLDVKRNEKVIVVKMQTVFDFVFNRWVYTASKT